MVSIREYVDSCNEEQLEILIRVANERQKYLKRKGKVILIRVFTPNCVKWFAHQNDANKYYLESAKESLNHPMPGISLEKEKVNLDQVADYLGKEAAAKFLASEPQIYDVPG